MLFIFASCSCLYSQNSVGRVENIRTEMNKNHLEIRYDISGSQEGTLHQTDLIMVDNMGNIVYPDSIYGDVGKDVEAGKDKVIVWEVYKEYDVIYGNFIAKVVLDAPKNRKHMGGPEFALLSLLVPGAGDYFVADWKESRIKPYYKTAFTAGTLGLSVAAYMNRAIIPPVMAPPGYYLSDDAPPGETLAYIDHYWMKVPEKTDYWLFPYDAEVFIGIGLASWLIDVFWVARKGVQNNRVRTEVLDHLSLVPYRQGMMLSFNLTF
jgi:hypothetical protein